MAVGNLVLLGLAALGGVLALMVLSSLGARRRAGTALSAIAICSLLAGCGDRQGVAQADAEEDPGCAQQTEKIIEDSAFTAYDQQLTHQIGGPRFDVVSLPDAGVVPKAMPAALAGLPLTGMTANAAERSYYTVAYGNELKVDESQSAFLAAGGIITIVTTGGEPGSSSAEELATDAENKGRVSVVPVGTQTAAVGWADPDENGVREHHVVWTAADGAEINLMAVREPERIVDIAREMAC